MERPEMSGDDEERRQKTRDPESLPAALVLAAGASKRMGGNKLLMKRFGRPMIHRVLDALEGAALSSVTVVCGYEADRLHPVLKAHRLGPSLRILTNPDYASGMASSLRRGLLDLPAGHGGVLVLLGDMPEIGPSLVADLLKRFDVLGRTKIVVPCCGGRLGNPRVWPIDLVAQMVLARGDRGANFLIRELPDRVDELDVDDPAVLRDVDTKEAFEQWQE